jgi:hypothetical protein
MSKLVDRIRKLLALANDAGASDNEADVARDIAAKLMTAHGILESDITESIVDEVATVDRTMFTDGNLEWSRYIGGAVARIVECKFYTTGNSGVWVGSTRQRETAQEMYSILVMEVERRAKIAMLWRKAEGFTDAGVYTKSFKLGMASAISDKSREMVESRAKPSDSTALERQDKLQKAIKDKTPPLYKGKGVNAKNTSGFSAGTAVGSTVELRRSVGGSSTKRLGSGSK